jgi:hypothetical protein
MIKVPFELLSDIINENIDIEVDGVHYWFHTEYNEERVKDIIVKTVIFERENYATVSNPDKLGGYFGLDIILTEHGDELEEDFNPDRELYPVRLREEIIQTFTRR